MSVPLKQSSAQPASVSEAPVPALTVRISALYEFWPVPVRQEITQFNWSDASIALPMNRLESVLKTGRVVFTWGDLIQWLDVSTASAASQQRETALELPLNVIVPLFMSQLPAPVAQKKITVGENIPNLFAGMGKPNS
jgi:hypothetical protein